MFAERALLLHRTILFGNVTGGLDSNSPACTPTLQSFNLQMNSTSNDPNWPRNGTIAKGKQAQPGWVQFENGFWLPTHQKGFQILFEVECR